ncbi:MAG TPA: HAMP domain-containing sensor histidine kinase [Oligoflexus sp.]|uniref:sensor histidine kinase n=1 Tax=Oligoflexus sp. TaxID=1971216 RepID=UPI002D7F5B3A|nr:HAMP domain-containing sensor histidine kinase [Oligoflexus sp.]HET9238067.1 HAMP domain-containing sensor histidine kinase [Oligoflexus sp.]
MRRLPLAFFAILTGASVLGLGFAWLMNVTLFGRPHGALLQLMAETAASGIDCEAPAQTPLFRQNADRGTLHYILLDAQGHILGQHGHIPADEAAVREGPAQSRWKADNPLRRESVWAKVAKVCGKDWTLWAWDPKNETYRHLLLPRQIILVVSCSSSIILVVLLAYLFLRKKGQEARKVLASIREGALGSRLVTRFWEPRLSLIMEFNHMAAAVEDSFSRLHEMEERRARLLSELAHDVRTPLASVRAAAETLSEFHAQLTPGQRQTLHQTLMLDVLYFQRLIDDLLILAQMERLDTTAPQQSTDLSMIVESLWPRMTEQYPALSATMAWPDPRPKTLIVPGDEPLIRRLLQNTLDNAFHYAQTYVALSIVCEDRQLTLKISNDAPPLSREDLQNWGHKRRQRIMTEKAGQPHTSLGLGSSIIVGVSRHLGGAARLEQNHTSPAGLAQITVIITLPWFNEST